MKLFLKILAGFLLTLVLIAVGLRIYFNDERLRETVVPLVNESLGAEIEVDAMSLSLFRAFPDAGVSMNGLTVPDKNGEAILNLDELLLSIKIIPLIGGNINISELYLQSPEIYYTVYEDSTTNIDFLLAEDPEAEVETEEEGMALAIPELIIENGKLHYNDHPGKMEIIANGLNGQLALQFADLLETDLQADLASLSVKMEGENYVENLALELDQISTLDLENELLEIQEGSLSIRGLALNLQGTVDSWSSEGINMDISVSSSSDDFGELLTLVPPEYEEHIAGLETRGALNINGTIAGSYSENIMPDFNFSIEVEDGYVKNNDLPEAIRDIQLSFVADNDQIAIQTFEAKAAQNIISVSGTVLNPLEENPGYDLNINSEIDLSTVEDFYAIGDFDIERLAGNLIAKVNAKGSVEDPKNSELDGTVTLSNGLVQYAGVSKPIENIEIDMKASNTQINIQSASLAASTNTLSFSGAVNNPLDEALRSMDVTGEINVDLATIKEFYPIDEDTLMMRGNLQSEIVLRGNLEPIEIENLLQLSTVSLTNGYFAHSSVGKPLEDITFNGSVTGQEIRISQAKFNTGNNRLSLKGNIRNYLSDDPVFNLTMDGYAQLSDVSNYYPLEPWIEELLGDAEMNLTAEGPAGDPLKIDLNGRLNLSEVSARGDSLPLPVTDLGGELSVTPTSMSLSDFSMKFGSSDIQLSGEMENYLSFIREDVSDSQLPNVTGNYHSELLNLDEMIDWEAESDPNEPVPIELPDVHAQVDADISKLTVLGISLTDISGRGELSPQKIVLADAKATMFEGTATGNMNWNVPKPTSTTIKFSGTLNELTAKAFFRDTGFLGKESTIHQYVEGALSADIEYTSDLDATLSPLLSTTDAEGSFGMTKARISGHPIQMKIANLLKAKELENLALDEWTSDFTIKNEVLTFKNLNLTSKDIGLELNGTHHLGNDNIDYKAVVALPGSFKKGLSSVISERAVNALEQENGTISVPLIITGTSENPNVRPDESVIKDIVEDYLKEKGGNLIKNLFGDN